MKQFFYLSVCCMLVLSACTGSFKKGEMGLEYKIISKGNGKKLSYGDYIQFHVQQVYAGAKDTVLQDSREMLPRIQVFDSINTPPAYYKILRQLKNGDSLVIRMLTDTAFKDSPQSMPPFMKKGKFLYTKVKVLNIFETQQQADSATRAEMEIARPRLMKKQQEQIENEVVKNKQQIEADGKIISAYLAKNNIKAEKTPWGSFIAMQTEGVGEKITNDNVVSVNYTGHPLDSAKTFDSNVDPKFNHTQPYDVNMAQPEVMIGWLDVLRQLKKGSKATVYIPSSLAYGKGGNPPAIGPDANLVFDIEVLNVETQEQFKARQEQIRLKMLEAERHKTDSLSSLKK